MLPPFSVMSRLRRLTCCSLGQANAGLKAWSPAGDAATAPELQDATVDHTVLLVRLLRMLSLADDAFSDAQ